MTHSGTDVHSKYSQNGLTYRAGRDGQRVAEAVPDGGTLRQERRLIQPVVGERHHLPARAGAGRLLAEP